MNNKGKRLKGELQDDVLNFQDVSINIEDERIFLSPFGLDILWLNREIENKLGLPGFYKKFQKYIIKSVEDFFQHHNKEMVLLIAIYGFSQPHFAKFTSTSLYE